MAAVKRGFAFAVTRAVALGDGDRWQLLLPSWKRSRSVYWDMADAAEMRLCERGRGAWRPAQREAWRDAEVDALWPR